MNDGVDNTLINELIEKAVQNYKTASYKYLDEVKTLVFTYLLNGFTYDEFNEKLDDLSLRYGYDITMRQKRDYKKIHDKTLNKDKKGEHGEFEISKDELDELKFKLDSTSPRRAREKFDRIVKRYYRTTNKTLQKEYINKEAYLTQNVTKYDKVEKVVPYYSKDTNKITSYHDIADYNSMVYNVNLTSTAWNATFDSCRELGEDIVYVEPHPFACDMCREYQGKFYSISGKSKNYPPLEEAISGGLKHPNCKHVITTYYGQEETDKYSTEEWLEMYDNKQKMNALELKISRLETDRDIYKELGNGEMVDKTNDKLNLLNSELEIYKRLTKIN